MASSDHLKPGEKGKIRLSVDLEGRTGNLAKTVKITSNDPLKPVVTLTIAMKIKGGPAGQNPGTPSPSRSVQ